MIFYICRGQRVVAVHSESEMVDPRRYGDNSYVIVDPRDGAAKTDPATGSYSYPAITTEMLEASCKWECKRRILQKISEAAQRNLLAHVVQIQLYGDSATSQQKADAQTASAIWRWIGRPDGMEGAVDRMVGADDREWYLDVKWPAWDAAWDQLVERM
jgi:hypothetical protein